MRIDLTVRYKCGCEECIRTVIGIPHELASAPRSKANDRKIADYIKENYHINWRCPKGHGIGIDSGFDDIIGIN
jgi:hypothetical protein